MAIFNKMRNPVFLKEDSDARLYVQNLKEIKEKATGELVSKIDNEIRIASAGLIGEDNIAFELKNCDMPIYILRDLHIKCADLSAQIDFAVVTKKFTLFIECKNLIGNIEIDSQGNFIRVNKYGGKWIKEGIYSPITQGQRHLDVMKKLLISRQSNKIMEFAADKLFDSMYKSIVVLANPKTVLNDKNAPKEIMGKVIRADQLSAYLKTLYKTAKEPACSDKQHLEDAENLLLKHQPNETDYLKKFQDILEGQKMNTLDVVHTKKLSSTNEVVSINRNNAKLFEELRQYRLEKSRIEDVKPYFIFNNKQLEHLVEVAPRSKKELLTVYGFGTVKTERYGDEILKIVSKFV